MSLTNLKVVERMHWLILSLIGSQFNFLNSFCNISAILSRLRQNRTHFYEYFEFYFSIFYKDYDTTQCTNNQNAAESIRCIKDS